MALLLPSLLEQTIVSVITLDLPSHRPVSLSVGSCWPSGQCSGHFDRGHHPHLIPSSHPMIPWGCPKLPTRLLIPTSWETQRAGEVEVLIWKVYSGVSTSPHGVRSLVLFLSRATVMHVTLPANATALTEQAHFCCPEHSHSSPTEPMST